MYIYIYHSLIERERYKVVWDLLVEEGAGVGADVHEPELVDRGIGVVGPLLFGERLEAELRPCAREIGVLLPNNQRQHRTLHIQKDVLPCFFFFFFFTLVTGP